MPTQSYIAGKEDDLRPNAPNTFRTSDISNWCINLLRARSITSLERLEEMDCSSNRNYINQFTRLYCFGIIPMLAIDFTLFTPLFTESDTNRVVLVAYRNAETAVDFYDSRIDTSPRFMALRIMYK